MRELTEIDIAMVAHEANRAYCRLLGDSSQPPWDDAADWHKQSCIAGVLAIQKDPDLSCEQSHQLWLERKLREGWKFGEVVSIERMEHPCCRPYHELPEEHRVKDLLFGTIVRVLMPSYPGITACAPGPHQAAAPACPPDCCVTTGPEPTQESLGEPPNPQAAPAAPPDPEAPPAPAQPNREDCTPPER